METELVEKVARIIHERVIPEEPWEDCPGLHNEHCSLAEAIIAAIDESRSVSVEGEAAALVMLANDFNIPPDVQEVLVHGSLSRNIKPGALKSLLAMKPLPAPPGDIE